MQPAAAVMLRSCNTAEYLELETNLLEVLSCTITEKAPARAPISTVGPRPSVSEQAVCTRQDKKTWQLCFFRPSNWLFILKLLSLFDWDIDWKTWKGKYYLLFKYSTFHDDMIKRKGSENVLLTGVATICCPCCNMWAGKRGDSSSVTSWHCTLRPGFYDMVGWGYC